jgi:two-component system response regulator HydG
MTQPIRILAVDDEPENCFVIHKALEEEGYELHLAYSGPEALESAEKVKPDLVLLDIRMPGMDGVEVLSHLRERNQDISVIVVSAFGDASVAVKCMKLGAYDYMTKPINIHELKITVANALRTRKLEDEVGRLKSLFEKRGLERLEGDSQPMKKVVELVRRVAEHDITVLITGESGTGKEVVAEAIHMESRRHDKPFVSIDCTALPEHLVESELFGFEKGAFTGASERKLGRFELANGGTLFLDEIGNLPLQVQVKLLRVLQERKLSRLGGKTTIPIDVRVIAATNADLKKMIAKGEFREDIFYRINEFTIHLPPLREREGDVELLAKHFLNRFNSQYNRGVSGFSPAARQAILKHTWTGNVRELQNAIKRAVILAESTIELWHLPQEVAGLAMAPEEQAPSPAGLSAESAVASALPAEGEEMPSLKEVTAQAVQQLEREMITRALKTCRWNKVKAAKMLQIDYKTLYNKLREYNIE